MSDDSLREEKKGVGGGMWVIELLDVTKKQGKFDKSDLTKIKNFFSVKDLVNTANDIMGENICKPHNS